MIIYISISGRIHPFSLSLSLHQFSSTDSLIHIYSGILLSSSARKWHQQELFCKCEHAFISFPFLSRLVFFSISIRKIIATATGVIIAISMIWTATMRNFSLSAETVWLRNDGGKKQKKIPRVPRLYAGVDQLTLNNAPPPRGSATQTE